ncbi:MAG: hypothetical protein KAH22_11160 [Thiotrichaceae bacterium]|nr:hypothetical protein [Thiotrichaceae bacterium]
MDKEIQQLSKVIQTNCHIADARHATDYTLCVYLLKMREMCRWEQGQSFNVALSIDDVGDWLTEREGLWDDLEEQDYQSYSLKGQVYKPFDHAELTKILNKKGLVYNAGLGIRCRPHFFLAELLSTEQEGELTIYIAGKEYARDMVAPPAMAQGNTIFIRRESIRRMLWEKVEEWRMSGLDNPIGRAAVYYNFDTDVESALDVMADIEIKTIIAHEKGELAVGKLLGSEWLDMLNALPHGHAEFMLRAVRDHLADALVTLPLLLSEANPACLHFYFGNMTDLRKKMAADLYHGYEQWHKKGSLDHLQQVFALQYDYWLVLAEQCLVIFNESKNDNSMGSAIESLIIEKTSYEPA